MAWQIANGDSDTGLVCRVGPGAVDCHHMVERHLTRRQEDVFGAGLIDRPLDGLAASEQVVIIRAVDMMQLLRALPGTIRMQPLAGVVSERATHAVRTSAGTRPQ